MQSHACLSAARVRNSVRTMMANVAEPKCVGILGMGHMGSGVGAELKRGGFDVATCLDGRSERTRNRASEAGVRDLGTLDALVAQCDTFLSIVPADQAEPLAAAVAERAQGKALHFVDCNSITPSKTERICKVVQDAGCTFSDGGIVGPPPADEAIQTRLFISGPDCDVLLGMSSDNMRVIRLSDSLKQATEMKVLFAAINKGAVALLTNVLAGAEHAGLLDHVVNEVKQIRPGLIETAIRSAPSLGDKGARWAIEMRDLAEGLEDLGVSGDYHQAAAKSYDQFAENIDKAGKGPPADLAGVLAAWGK